MNRPDVPGSQGRRSGRHAVDAPGSAVLEQTSLEQVVERLGPLTPQQAATVGLAVLDQLVAVHNRGMLHGDVRPGSVLVGPHDRITLAAPTLRSPAFTAPEGVTGPAADLWSLGATLYTAVEGRPPSPGGSLDNAGALGSALFALLSGDPAQRPEPGVLRNTLLDLSRNGGHTPLPPVRADVAPPPSTWAASAPFPTDLPQVPPASSFPSDPFSSDPLSSGAFTSGPFTSGPFSSDPFSSGPPQPVEPPQPVGPTGPVGPPQPVEPMSPAGPVPPAGPRDEAVPAQEPPPASEEAVPTSPFPNQAQKPQPPQQPQQPQQPVSRELVPVAPVQESETRPATRSSGILVPRPIVGLTGGLLLAMAVTIGVLLSQRLGAPTEEADARVPGPGGALFASAPRACGLLDDKQVAEVVPGFRSSAVEATTCDWLNQQDWRKPSTEKFDLTVRLVAQKQDASGVTRAKQYLAGKRQDVATSTSDPRPTPPKDLKGVGEEAFTTGSYSKFNLYGGAYKVTVVLRISNLIAEVEYGRGGVKDDADGQIAAGAEKVARWLTTSLKTNG
ncbi:protein kinase family protein [Streptosporangium saharense]|uniref:hypothetical protein n=1 Tax=Streptosporangium saharense TaxID=1706840 RepID=UPI0036BBEC57